VRAIGLNTKRILFWLGFDHVEVEAQLYQADFVMVCRMRADRKRQSMAIDNRHDFHAFSALRGSDLRSAALGHNKRCVDEAFCFVERATVAKFVGNIRQDPAQNLVEAARGQFVWLGINHLIEKIIKIINSIYGSILCDYSFQLYQF
jgi:hypothetical protein